MSQRPVAIADVEEATSRFDRAIEWLLIGLLVFMPLAFGAVEAWSEMVVIAFGAAMALCLALKLVLEPESRLVWSWAYVPVGILLAIVALQLVPLPTALVAGISPTTASLKTSLLSDLPGNADGLKTMAVSFYPLATRHDLRLFLVAAVVFFVVLNVYRQPDQVKRLLGAVAIIGGAMVLLALAQALFGNGRIYWTVPTVNDKAISGTFICHSHYGQFMNLSIGGALGLLLVKLHEAFRQGPVTVASVVERLGQPELRVVWWLVAMIVAGAGTIFLSLTRGGMVSFLIALAFSTLVLTSLHPVRGRGWIMVGLALGAFVCVLYVGFDAVYDRLATLQEQKQYEGRWQIVKDLSVSFTRFPVVGTGLGTHEVVYPMFDRSTSSAVAAYAENEYAQLAEETGVLGLVLLLAFFTIVWRGYVYSVRHLGLPVRVAAVGLGFGLLAVLAHSLSDFGQHLPANHCLTAVFCALLIGLPGMGHATDEQPRWWRALTRLRPVRVLAGLCVVTIFAWALSGANSARRAESHWNKAFRLEESLERSDWQATNEDYARLISHAAAAAEYEPGNVKYRHWLNVYRWRSISRVTDPETGRLVMTSRSLGFTRRIVDELHQARALCPTFGPAYSAAGQLERFILNDPAGAEHIRTGYSLAPADAMAAYVAGLVDATEGAFDASLEKFRKCLAVDGRMARDVVDVYVNQIGRPDLAVAWAGDNQSWLSLVADALEKTGSHKGLATSLAVKARSAVAAKLRAQCEQPGAPAAVLASVAELCVSEEDYPAAIDCYRRALAQDYGQIAWRLALARLLADTGKVAEALHEARICLRLRPQNAAARKLIEDLSVRMGAAPGL